MEFDQFCDEVLSLIEYEENSLLNWGFTEVEVDLESELSPLLEKLTAHLQAVWEDFQEEHGFTEDDILNNLRERRLIFQIDGGQYRSRFAEIMRLLLLLRQRFDYSDWATAPRLVADARIQLQRRRYPKRDISYQAFIDSLSDLQLTPVHRKTLDILLRGTDGTYYNWAGFQQRATHEIFRQLNRREQSGVIIGAGTGSGKTKAAYIPSLTWLDSRITSQHRVSIIAIYPRNELLKDQFVEAIRETERLNLERRKHGKRPIVLGAFYGDTPSDVFEFKEDQDWDVAFMRCPNCNSTLTWSVADRAKKNHVLRCQACRYESNSDHVLVTRMQMQETPPDILFTTTEMLNRNLSQTKQWAVFGIQQSQPPEMLLLDEVHTYEGVSGANVAYLIRRWRHACGYAFKKHTLCVVGLSATLSHATETFAKLIGLSSKNVRYITPDKDLEVDEIDTEGIEYNVILKGDASSRTALLSTSIQTAMLLARTLSTIADKSSASNTYPPKIFAFVNRLDTLNRWFDNQMDAEKNRLSQYRDWDQHTPAPTPTEIRAIKRSGQDWRIASLIGHKLNQQIEIDRTSSQSRGVMDKAKLVIATSSLEVGYNDHRVGAVMQHQSPVTMASFLQRKGRAGRNRQTRPWTVVILSDYGRDRVTFQNAERLFDPLLPPINLPLQNYYVQKIQASFVLMDWLTQRLHNQFPDLNIWRLLYKGEPHRVNETVRDLLQQLLTDSTMIADYENYLRLALGLIGSEFDSTIHSLLWGEPRPILREVVPTVLRQLESNWQFTTISTASGSRLEQKNIIPPEKPLPEFVPSTLFFDLNLPELTLFLGNRQTPLQEPFLQTFEEIVPGRVSKRYLPHRKYGARGYWIELPDDNERHTYDLSSLSIEFEPHRLPLTLKVDEEVYRIRRPICYRLTNVPSNVSSTSTAWPIWRSSFTPKGLIGEVSEGHLLSSVRHSLWDKLVEEVRLYTQALSNTVMVTRGMIGVQITHLRNEERIFGNRFFIEQDEPSGIGYSMDVDGLCIQYQHLDQVALRQSPEWESLLHLARPQLFAFLLQNDHNLKERFNLSPFEIEWIYQVALAGLVATAVGADQNLPDAHEFLSTHFMKVIEHATDAIFQGVSDEDDNTDRGRTADGLLDRFRQLPIQQIVLRHMTVLWETHPPQLASWLDLQYASSLACTLFSTLTTIVADIDPMDLNLDVIYSARQIWITESSPGGVGLIAKIAEAMTQYPRRLTLQLNDTIRHCERDQRSSALNVVINSLKKKPNGPIAQAFVSIRDRRDFVSVSSAKQQLNSALFSEHLAPTRELVVALNAKMLRPNSTPDTDRLTHDLIDTWTQEQHRLGIEIGLRVFAVAVLNRDVIREQINSILKSWGYTGDISDPQRVNLVESMLWQSCHDSCEECINHKPRYQSLVKPSRLILRSLIPARQQVVDYQDSEWRFNLIRQLQDHNEGTLCCRHDELATVKRHMMAFLTEPVEVGMQIFYPILEAVEYDDDFWLLHIILREMVGV